MNFHNPPAEARPIVAVSQYLFRMERESGYLDFCRVAVFGIAYGKIKVLVGLGDKG